MKYTLLAVLALIAMGCGKTAQSEPGTQAGAQTAKPIDPTKPITEERLGVKFYPGARVVTSGETDSVVSANLETSDPAAKAIAFYEEELGVKVDTKGGLPSIEGTKGKIKYAIVVAASGGVTSITIMGGKL